MGRVWQQAAKELEEAEEVIMVGYSLPKTDVVLRNLFALGSADRIFIRRFTVFNPENSRDVKGRFSSLVRPRGVNSVDYHPLTFDEEIRKVGESYVP